uniref:Laminin G domain-containing protein n=1 Tax=Ciona savignyi TaxID=51511 RepID=H2YKF5_CIOSA
MGTSTWSIVKPQSGRQSQIAAWLLYCICLAILPNVQTTRIDLLDRLKLSTSLGVSRVSGICEGGRTALRVSESSQTITLPSAYVFKEFQTNGFPTEFTISAVIKPESGVVNPFLLRMKHELTWRQLGFTVGESPEFHYRVSNDELEQFPTFSSVNLADGRWHKVAWSVYNEMVQLWVDCLLIAEKEVRRDTTTQLSLGGAVVFGEESGSVDKAFVGDIESFHIDSDPNIAGQMCRRDSDLSPDCRTPSLFA